MLKSSESNNKYRDALRKLDRPKKRQPLNDIQLDSGSLTNSLAQSSSNQTPWYDGPVRMYADAKAKNPGATNDMPKPKRSKGKPLYEDFRIGGSSPSS